MCTLIEPFALLCVEQKCPVVRVLVRVIVIEIPGSRNLVGVSLKSLLLVSDRDLYKTFTRRRWVSVARQHNSPQTEVGCVRDSREKWQCKRMRYLVIDPD